MAGASRAQHTLGHKLGGEGTTFDELWEAYPTDGCSDIIKAAGLKGSLKPMDNDSALRLSVALNATGNNLEESDPFTGKQVKTSSGDLLSVSAPCLYNILVKKLGKPKHLKKGQEGALGKQGIIYIDATVGGDKGYLDLWKEKEAPRAEDHWGEGEAYIWEW